MLGGPGPELLDSVGHHVHPCSVETCEPCGEDPVGDVDGDVERCNGDEGRCVKPDLVPNFRPQKRDMIRRNKSINLDFVRTNSL